LVKILLFRKPITQCCCDIDPFVTLKKIMFCKGVAALGTGSFDERRINKLPVSRCSKVTLFRKHRKRGVQASRQASKQASKQGSKQAGRQANKQAGKQVSDGTLWKGKMHRLGAVRRSWRLRPRTNKLGTWPWRITAAVFLEIANLF
jgi:hypothetical protein